MTATIILLVCLSLVAALIPLLAMSRYDAETAAGAHETIGRLPIEEGAGSRGHGVTGRGLGLGALVAGVALGLVGALVTARVVLAPDQQLIEQHLATLVRVEEKLNAIQQSAKKQSGILATLQTGVFDRGALARLADELKQLSAMLERDRTVLEDELKKVRALRKD